MNGDFEYCDGCGREANGSEYAVTDQWGNEKWVGLCSICESCMDTCEYCGTRLIRNEDVSIVGALPIFRTHVSEKNACYNCWPKAQAEVLKANCTNEDFQALYHHMGTLPMD